MRSTLLKDYLYFSLFAIVPILFLYNNNSGMLHPSDLIRPLIVSLLLIIIVTFIFNKFINDKNRSRLSIQLFLLFFFSYGYYQNHIADQFSITPIDTHNSIFVIPYFIFFIIIGYMLLFKFDEKLILIQVLNRAFLFLFLINSVVFLFGNFKSPKIYSHVTDNINKNITSNAPDIYLIVLDGHGREDILKEFYDYDDSEFIRSLENMDFYIADKAQSSYVQTYLSMAGMFNMDYLDPDNLGLEIDDTDRAPLLDLMQNNDFFKILENNGYRFINYTSGWAGSVDQSKSDRQFLDPKSLSEFEFSLLNASIIPLFTGSNMAYDHHRYRMQYIFNELPKVAQIKEKTFTYAHILAPHPPFVFGTNGKYTYDSGYFTLDDGGTKVAALGGKDVYVSKYIEQVSYIDKVVVGIINEILENSSEPSVIILMSDHGPASMFKFGGVPDGKEIDNGLKERFSILSAFYFPDKDYESLREDFSQLNTFRVVLNKYFGTRYDLIDGRKKIYSTWLEPYDFIDVTERYFNENY